MSPVYVHSTEEGGAANPTAPSIEPAAPLDIAIERVARFLSTMSGEDPDARVLHYTPPQYAGGRHVISVDHLQPAWAAHVEFAREIIEGRK